MRLRSPIILCIALTGCTAAEEAANDLARRSAKATVSTTLATEFPQVPPNAVTPFTDCIIEAADARELATLARASVTGVDPGTRALVGDILHRPQTAGCLGGAALQIL